MKWLLFIAALGVAQGADAGHPELAEIKTLYLLPMTYSLDQFLAIRLTKGGVVQVVTDPKLAYAIISDHIGGSLESQWKTLYGEPKVDGADKDKPSFTSGPMA